MNFCHKCGTSLLEDSAFCQHCGVKNAPGFSEPIGTSEEFNQENRHSDFSPASPQQSTMSNFFICNCGDDVFEKFGYRWVSGTIMTCNYCGKVIIDEDRPDEETDLQHFNIPTQTHEGNHLEGANQSIKNGPAMLLAILITLVLGVVALNQFGNSNPVTPSENRRETNTDSSNSGHWESKCRREFIRTNSNPQNVNEITNSGYWVEKCTDVWVTD